MLIRASSPALMTGVGVVAVTMKSTTFTVCEQPVSSGAQVDWSAPSFAVALPVTVMGGGGGLSDGVTSTSTLAVAFTVRVGMKQEIDPNDPSCGGTNWVQLPEPLLTSAVGSDARSVAGTLAVKTRKLAGSVPSLVMSKVNATCCPAATGLGDGKLGDDTTIAL